MNPIIKQLLNGTAYSLQGLTALFHSTLAFRMEVMGCVILMPIIYLMDAEFTAKLLLITLALLVLIVEAINTGIEVTINRISLDQHILSKQAKDIGSAAVFLTLILNALVWLIILLN